MPLIVVMEDDAATCMLMTSVLKKDGYTVWSADNDVQGLDLIRTHKPELVISDIQMPVMNGLPCCNSYAQSLNWRQHRSSC